jgi:hypothetical protein
MVVKTAFLEGGLAQRARFLDIAKRIIRKILVLTLFRTNLENNIFWRPHFLSQNFREWFLSLSKNVF